MDISHRGLITILGMNAIVCPAQYCDQTRSLNARRSPPVYSLALRLRNTKVPVWTHESIGYPKMDISHWDAAIHYGDSACPILWSKRSGFQRYWANWDRPCVLPCPRLRNTKVPVWTHESIGYPKMDISHWEAAIHYGIQLAQYCDRTRSGLKLFHRDRPCVLPCP